MVWRSWGISVFLFFLIWLGVTAALPHTIILAPKGVELQWALGIACLLTAATAFLLAWYRRSHPRKVADPQTNATVLVPHVDDFFFIPMKWWTYILLGIAAVLMGAAALGIVLVD